LGAKEGFGTERQIGIDIPRKNCYFWNVKESIFE